MNIPCKDCLIFPVCKSLYSNTLQTSSLRKIVEHCSLIHNYIFAVDKYKIVHIQTCKDRYSILKDFLSSNTINEKKPHEYPL